MYLQLWELALNSLNALLFQDADEYNYDDDDFEVC